jgi:hypothetical protein
VGLGFRV